MKLRRSLHIAPWLLQMAALSAVASAAERPPPVAPKAGGRFDIAWHSIDSGSPIASQADRYTVSGAIGQTDVGTLSGGPYRIDLGYWAGSGVLAVGVRIFSNDFEADAAAARADVDAQAARQR